VFMFPVADQELVEDPVLLCVTSDQRPHGDAAS
jgi:hypothetical protein